MSEKRFEVSFDEKRIVDIYAVNKNTTEYDIHKSCDLINSLYEENERLKNKLNVTALELVDEVISMGKAVEISEMNYHEFLEYRKKNGKPMELQI